MRGSFFFVKCLYLDTETYVQSNYFYGFIISLLDKIDAI